MSNDSADSGARPGHQNQADRSCRGQTYRFNLEYTAVAKLTSLTEGTAVARNQQLFTG